MSYKGNAKCIPHDVEAIFLPYQSAWIKDDSILKLMEALDSYVKEQVAQYREQAKAFGLAK